MLPHESLYGVRVGPVRALLGNAFGKGKGNAFGEAFGNACGKGLGNAFGKGLGKGLSLYESKCLVRACYCAARYASTFASVTSSNTSV